MRQDEQRAVDWLQTFDETLAAELGEDPQAARLLAQVHATAVTLSADRYSGFMFQTTLGDCFTAITRIIAFDGVTLGPAGARLWRYHPLAQGQRWMMTDPDGRYMAAAPDPRPKRHFWTRRKYS
ncbi:hypothetical protein [Lacticaseibacillus absianus]|uniref:hypothetical protein n=1 Tax=Lacticaseibacillus absianus TaxID=2729623 RepID=UPI0015CEA81D|nr:hypothetical protein [Lacticaseibacillus absianus]